MLIYICIQETCPISSSPCICNLLQTSRLSNGDKVSTCALTEVDLRLPCCQSGHLLLTPATIWRWMVSVNRILVTVSQDNARKMSCCCLVTSGLLFTYMLNIQYIPRNMHTVFALLCFVVVIHWLIFPYPSGLLHWHCGNLTIAPVPAKQPWWIWINTSCEFIMNDFITPTKQSTTKPCAYFLGYTVG